MAKTLHVSADQKEVHQANNWLLIDLNNRGQRGNYELAIANRLWGQKDYNFLKDFLETLDKFYLAAMGEVDFMKATEDARQTINKWVEDKTRDRIKELIPQGILSAATVLVLTNAIYFKGTWLQKFKPEDTKDLPFHTSPTDTVNVPTMYQNNDKALYADVDDLQILELPYKGDEISMMLVVPKQKDGLAALETSLSSEKFDAWRSKLQKQEKVELYLPKFKLTKDFNLNQPLKNLGMVKAFTDADFSGINGQKDLFIQAVLHKAFVEINEEGTEAAAATAVVVGRTSVEPSHPVIRADRPFVFALFDRTTNCILFIGRVANPAKAE
jgi:serpin B